MTDPRGRLARWSLVLCLALAAMPVARAEDLRARAIKAAYVLNIARFVNWADDRPQDRQQVIRLCLYKHDPFGKAADVIRGKPVAKRTLDVRQVEAREQVDACDILFVGARQFAEFVQAAPVRPGLLLIADSTFSDSELAQRSWAGLSLLRDGARIAIEVNQDRLNGAGLTLSSELLKLARPIAASALGG